MLKVEKEIYLTFYAFRNFVYIRRDASFKSFLKCDRIFYESKFCTLARVTLFRNKKKKKKDWVTLLKNNLDSLSLSPTHFS